MRDYPRMIANACAQFEAYLVAVRLEGGEVRCGALGVKETKENPRDGEIRRHAHAGYGHECSRCPGIALPLEDIGQIFLYDPCESLLSLAFFAHGRVLSKC